MYIRYANVLLLGFIGLKIEFNLIFSKFCSKLNLETGISFDSINIQFKHYKQGIIFLGYKIQGIISKIDSMLNKNNLIFLIPLIKLINCFKERGFFQKARKSSFPKYVARRQDAWLFLNFDYEILQRFNLIILAIETFFSGASNKKILNEF